MLFLKIIIIINKVKPKKNRKKQHYVFLLGTKIMKATIEKHSKTTFWQT